MTMTLVAAQRQLLLLFLLLLSSLSTCFTSPRRRLRKTASISNIRRRTTSAVLPDSPSSSTRLSQSSSTTTTTPADDSSLVLENLPVLTLCCLIAAICALDRVVMSIAILPMGDEFGYEDGTKGLPQSFHRNLLESELNPSGKDTSKNPTAGSKNNSLSGATG